MGRVSIHSKAKQCLCRSPSEGEEPLDKVTRVGFCLSYFVLISLAGFLWLLMLFLVLSCWTQKGWQDRCPRFIDLAWVFSSSTPEGERDRASLVYLWFVFVVSFSSDLRNDKPVQKGRMPLLWKSKQLLSCCLVWVLTLCARSFDLFRQMILGRSIV